MAETRNIQHQTKNIRGIYEEYLRNTNEVNLNPAYQRNFCWNKDKQNLFIDSIMNNYIIPPIVLLQKKRKLSTDFKYDCVDGQHRLKVIKYFIEGTPVPSDDNSNNHLIYWLDDTNKKTYYENIPSNKKYARVMIIEEKDRFLDFLIPIIILKIDEDNELNKDYINDVFLRLQKGEKVAAYDIMKNSDLPVIKAINLRSLFTSNPYNDASSKYSYLEKILGIVKSKTSNKHWKKTIFPLVIMKCMILINRKSLIIGSYVDVNITNEIKKIRTGYSRLDKLTFENTKQYLDTFELFITNLFTNNILNIHQNLFYILLYLFIKQKSKYDFYIAEHNKYKIIIKSNDIKLYQTFKKKKSEKCKTFLDGYDLEKVIGYLDLEIQCPIKTELTAKETKGLTSGGAASAINLEVDEDSDEDSDEDTY